MNKRRPFLTAALLAALALPAAAQEQAKPAAPAPEQAELSKLTAENQLADQKLRKKLQQLNSEKEELRAQYELDLQKARLAALEADLAKMTAENKLAEERRKAETAAMESEYQRLASKNKLSSEQVKALTTAQSDELQRLGLENRLAEEKTKKLMGELALKIAKLKADNDLKAEQQRADFMADSKERINIDTELKRLDLEERKLKLEKMTLDNRAARLGADLELRAKKTEWKKESNAEPVYTDKPFRDGKLIISDRRIPLNGSIHYGVGAYVTERINYFNNISTQPVFIVIDESPGGSTAEGYAILKAMESSRAPVYVAVKSYAASMAAIIATMAEKSYAYPGAQILHHQMWGPAMGNLVQINEQVEFRKEWEKRLYGPLSKKTGMSLEEFRKKMYEKNSDGDWREFGDKAVGYKWITATADKMEETGVFRNPDENPAARGLRSMAGLELPEKLDEKGQAYVALPRLKPFDFYFIYNRDGYYRY